MFGSGKKSLEASFMYGGENKEIRDEMKRSMDDVNTNDNQQYERSNLFN